MACCIECCARYGAGYHCDCNTQVAEKAFDFDTYNGVKPKRMERADGKIVCAECHIEVGHHRKCRWFRS